MNDNQSGLILKRLVTLTMIVTPRWKQEMQQQLQAQINQLDAQLQQIEVKGNQAVTELQRQSKSSSSERINQQIQEIQTQVNQKRNEALQKKNQVLQLMQQAQLYELNQEVQQTQPLESFFRIEKGDNLVKKMNVEIVMRDGIVEEIRGEM